MIWEEDSSRAWCWSSQPPELITYKPTVIISYVGTNGQGCLYCHQNRFSHLWYLLVLPIGRLCLYLLVGYSEVNFSRVSTHESTNAMDCERVPINIDLLT